MADTVRWTGSTSPQRSARPETQQSGTDLADILERVLDKGIVIAGDIQVNLLDIELLTIKIRLIVASVDRAKEMGIDWWERDPTLSSGRGELEDENARLRERIERLEATASGGELEDGSERDTADLPDDEIEETDEPEPETDESDETDEPELEPEETAGADDGDDDPEEVEERPARPARRTAARTKRRR
ncbi:gas vesicle protein [Pseudonocardia parietis]|uniref:Gas vesicle structural protein n=1 Tax=Pseudonocardia parietis TaxID=570936 RepID=A0ABS4W1B2_9PSEU|nr:hypothetical protein [Pseudonocardia parietis]